MQTKTYNSLGLNVNLEVPASVEEFDANAKRVNACLDEATNNIIYRGSLAEFRSLFLHGQQEVKSEDGSKTIQVGVKGVDELSGIARKTKSVELTSKNEDGSPKTSEVYDESEAVYFKRVNAALGLDTPEKITERWQPLANDVAALIKFDASASERKPAAPKTLPKKYLEYADKKIAEGKGDALARKLSKLLKREVAADRESLARAIKEDMDAEAARREAALMAV